MEPYVYLVMMDDPEDFKEWVVSGWASEEEATIEANYLNATKRFSEVDYFVRQLGLNDV